MTYERCANVLKLYVNGGLMPADTFITPTLGSIAHGGFMLVGRARPGFPPDFYRGCLDELEFFKRVLTTNEIRSIWAAGSAGKCKPGAKLPRFKLATTSVVAGQLTIEWSGNDAMLQSADAITGPWTNEPEATSGYRPDMNDPRKFYRLIYQ